MKVDQRSDPSSMLPRLLKQREIRLFEQYPNFSGNQSNSHIANFSMGMGSRVKKIYL